MKMDSASCLENRFIIFLSSNGTRSTFAYFSTSSERVTWALARRCRRGKEVARCKQAHCCFALFTRANGGLSSKQQWMYGGKKEGSALASCVLSLLLLTTLPNLSQMGWMRISALRASTNTKTTYHSSLSWIFYHSCWKLRYISIDVTLQRKCPFGLSLKTTVVVNYSITSLPIGGTPAVHRGSQSTGTTCISTCGVWWWEHQGRLKISFCVTITLNWS